MADSHVGSALESLRVELAQVEGQLSGYEALRARRERLLAAIEATEAVEAMGRPVPAAPESLRSTVLRHILTRHVQAVEPDTPSEAAMAILREVGRPVHIRDLVALIQGKGWFSNRTYESLRATIAGTLDARAARQGGCVVKTEKATYLWVPSTDSIAVVETDGGEIRITDRTLDAFSEGWRSAMAGNE